MSTDETQRDFQQRFGHLPANTLLHAHDGYLFAEQRIKEKLLSEEMVDIAAKAMADAIGHGMREKCTTSAKAALQAIVEGLFGVGSESESGVGK